MSSNGDSDRPRNAENTFKILIATDIHLGFEAKTKRAKDNDSMVTFEEILQLAHKNQVDFILLGGDLFHQCKPSQRVLLDCLNLLKKYCLGTRPISVKFLTDPEEIFIQTEHKVVNYEDSNLNVSMPIFSIHGNHDNPSFENTGAMDLMMASGMINYFGKWSNLQELDILPMIFQKGDSHIAIYGLGHINEQRLCRMFIEGSINFVEPTIPNCFCILVIHQNRARHAENEYIDEDRFPEWFDMIFWGHEHECRIRPERARSRFDGEYDIIQPGSSVATSYCEGEAVEKNVGLLLIHGNEYKIKPLKLQTVRPFLYETLSIPHIIEKGYCGFSTPEIADYVDDYIENELLPKAQKLLTGHEKQPKEPLIRLKIVWNDLLHRFDTNDITRKYNDIVANPKEMFIFRKDKPRSAPKRKNDHIDDLTEELDGYYKTEADTSNTEEWTRTVQREVKRLMEQRNIRMDVLSVAGLNEALSRCIIGGDDESFEYVVEHQLKRSYEHLLANRPKPIDHDTVSNELAKFRAARAKKNGDIDEAKELQNMLQDPKLRSEAQTYNPALDDLVDDYDTAAAPVVQPTGRGRGRGSRGGATRARGGTRGRGRGKKTLDVVETPVAKPKQPELNLPRFSYSSTPRSNSPTSASTSSSRQRATQFQNSDSD